MGAREPRFAAETRDIAAPRNDRQLADAVGLLADRLAAAGQFSGVILLEKDGSPLVARAWGMANRGAAQANTLETAFDIGSVGKFITQIAILQLVEQGKVTLDDTIGQHLRDYPNPEAAAKVKVRHLLKHQGGLAEHGGMFSPEEQAEIKQLKDFLPGFASQPLRFEPGAGEGYSNSGYIVLGLIVEAASGENYFDYVRTRILQPAGMSSSGFFDRAELPAHVARSYQGDRDATRMHARQGSSAGGMQATAPDMQRLMRAMNSGKLLKPESIRRLTSEVLPPNPYSIAAAAEGRLAGVGYAGGAPGVSAMCVTSRDGRYVAAILANAGGGVAVDFWVSLRDWINQLPTE